MLTDKQQVKNFEGAIALVDEVQSFVDASPDAYAIEQSN
jgi:hypothetical protein